MRSAEGTVHAVSPVVAEPFNDVGAELLQSGTDIEMVIDTTVLEQSKANYESDLELGAEHDGIELFVYEGSLGVGLAFDDERCCLGVYDGSNNLRAVLESDDERLHEWMAETFGDYRGQAAPLGALYDDESAVEGVER